jgi:8-oxo-dGTP diphosphatase
MKALIRCMGGRFCGHLPGTCTATADLPSASVPIKLPVQPHQPPATCDILPPAPTRYVCGFLFSPDRGQVVLVRKDRPKWQAGCLNGLGGKVEPGESIGRAMAREFYEESGVLIPISSWNEFATLEGPDFHITFFRAFDEAFSRCRTMESEEVVILPTWTIPAQVIVSNLAFLIPLALNEDGMGVVHLSRAAPDEAKLAA